MAKERGSTREQVQYFAKRQTKARLHGRCVWCLRGSDGQTLCPRCKTPR